MQNNLCDISAERAILAGLVQHASAAYLDVSDILSEAKFTQHINQILYSVLSHVYAKKLHSQIDLALILSSSNELGLHNELKDEIKYINTLFQFHVELSNLRGFAIKLRKLYEARELICRFDETVGQIREISGNETISEIVAIAEKPIFDFTNKLIGGNQQVQQIGDGIDEYINALHVNPDIFIGADIDYPIYQNCVGGLRMGIHIIGARKKIGKSFFAGNAAIASSGKNKIPTLLMDTELSREQGQWIRFLSRISEVEQNNIKYGKIFNDEEQDRVIVASRILRKLPLDYVNITGKTFDEVLSIIRRWLIQKVGYNKQGELNKCLVIYDYLKLSEFKDLKTATEWQLLGFRTTQLHDLCTQYNFPILLFAQLNRENEIASSDRLSWFCTSYSSFHKKSDEEIAEDGPQNGNRKLIIEDVRFDAGLEQGDYINYYLDGSRARLRELKTRNQVVREKKNNENNVIEEEF